MIEKNPLYISHKVWCALIKGAPDAECNCEGVPSPKQQLLARALKALVEHKKVTLDLMNVVKQCAEEVTAERKTDWGRTRRMPND